MKIHIIALSLILMSKALCSWPSATFEAGQIANDTNKILSVYLAKGEVYLTASDYRGLTLIYHKDKSKHRCKIPIGYYEAHSWLSGGYEDKEIEGWSRRPDNSTENYHKDLASLLGILDKAKIKYKRTSLVRTKRSTQPKMVYAIWNYVEFDVPDKSRSVILDFLRDLYADYPVNAKVHIYPR